MESSILEMVDQASLNFSEPKFLEGAEFHPIEKR
jgi:hypothetical protein